MVIEKLSREKMIEQLELAICMASDGSHDDLSVLLNSLKNMTQKYTEDFGIKVICGNDEFTDLFLPCFKVFLKSPALGLGLFGSNTSIMDIYRLDSMRNQIDEYVLSTVPYPELNDSFALLYVPLRSYYDLMIQVETKMNNLHKAGSYF